MNRKDISNFIEKNSSFYGFDARNYRKLNRKLKKSIRNRVRKCSCFDRKNGYTIFDPYFLTRATPKGILAHFDGYSFQNTGVETITFKRYSSL